MFLKAEEAQRADGWWALCFLKLPGRGKIDLAVILYKSCATDTTTDSKLTIPSSF